MAYLHIKHEYIQISHLMLSVSTLQIIDIFSKHICVLLYVTVILSQLLTLRPIIFYKCEYFSKSPFQKSCSFCR